MILEQNSIEKTITATLLRLFVLVCIVAVTNILIPGALVQQAQATHFRYGHLQWSPTGATAGGGTSTGTLTYKIDAMNVVEDWVFAHAVDPVSGNDWKHVYTTPGPFTARIDSCCRTYVEVNNSSRSNEISTIVDLHIANKSPVSTVLPIVPCPRDDGPCIFVIPAADQTPTCSPVVEV